MQNIDLSSLKIFILPIIFHYNEKSSSNFIKIQTFSFMESVHIEKKSSQHDFSKDFSQQNLKCGTCITLLKRRYTVIPVLSFCGMRISFFFRLFSREHRSRDRKYFASFWTGFNRLWNYKKVVIALSRNHSLICSRSPSRCNS